MKKIPTVLAQIFLAQLLFAWNGEPWRFMTRQEVQARAFQMMDTPWSPNRLCQGWNSGISPSSFYPGLIYYGILYTQHNSYQSGEGAKAQNNWSEFKYGITHLSSDNYGYSSGGRWYNYYGNDCSGFVSVCWALPSRQTTGTFQNDANGPQSFCYPLGPAGSAATVILLPGDALNEGGSHIFLFERKSADNRIESMEQTPNAARRRAWFYSSLSTYQPLRRKNISDSPSSYVMDIIYPKKVMAERIFSIEVTCFLAPSESPSDLHFEIRHKEKGEVLYYAKLTLAHSGINRATLADVCLPDLGKNYHAYCLLLISPAGASRDNIYCYHPCSNEPILVFSRPPLLSRKIDQ